MRSILGIDTASPAGSVALALDGRAVAWEPLAPGGHSSGLSEAALRLLEARSLGWKDLAGIAVSRGPGSFTGLRIGLAWAKGMALGRGTPLVLVPAAEASARAHADRAERVVTMIPGERGRLEVALWSGTTPELLRGPETIPEEGAIAWASGAAERRGVAIAPATPKLARALAAEAEGSGVPVLEPVLLAAAVAEIGDRRLRAGEREDPVTASPSYGRAPDARRPASAP